MKATDNIVEKRLNEKDKPNKIPTTVYLEPDTLRVLREIAKEQGVSPSSLANSELSKSLITKAGVSPKPTMLSMLALSSDDDPSLSDEKEQARYRK